MSAAAARRAAIALPRPAPVRRAPVNRPVDVALHALPLVPVVDDIPVTDAVTLGEPPLPAAVTPVVATRLPAPEIELPPAPVPEFGPSQPGSPVGDGSADGFFDNATSAFKKTGESIVNTTVKTGSSIIKAFGLSAALSKSSNPFPLSAAPRPSDKASISSGVSMNVRVLVCLCLGWLVWIATPSAPEALSLSHAGVAEHDLVVDLFSDAEVRGLVKNLEDRIARHAEPARFAFDFDQYLQNFVDGLQGGMLSRTQEANVIK